MNDANDSWGREPVPPATDDTWGREPVPPARNDGWGREAVPPPAGDDPTLAVPARTSRRVAGSQNARIAGALILGGVAGAAILGPVSTLAASAAPSASESVAASEAPSASTEASASEAPAAASQAPAASATATATPTPSATSTPSTTSGSGSTGAGDEPNEVRGGPGGHVEAVSDTSVVAKAIGISEADLLTALQGGQTVAQVAAAHNVPLQTVIDALVADGQAELDAAVKAGTLTQAQADAEKAELTQRATDQANGSFGGGRH